VDPWDEERDARRYDGPHAVVAHPPCQRWGRYWFGGPSVRVRKIKGDDAGCFASALASVRRYGGVLEHPEASSAWAAHGLLAPPKSGGWHTAGDFLGWTCCVEQGHYGHRARKATWLYAVGCELPGLVWGPSARTIRLDHGYHSAAERAAARSNGTYRSRENGMARLRTAERSATPPLFRDVLLSIARSAHRAGLDSSPVLLLP
jgi:hypothetical protein